MKNILISLIIIITLIGISIYSINDKNNSEENEIANKESEIKKMKISISDGENTIIYELNDSTTASELYNQLPLKVDVENFSSNEKIFYPPKALSTANSYLANDGGEGVLAYYAPWKDVVMFYSSFSTANGLYEIGMAIEGCNLIKNLTGEITIEKVE